MCKHILDAANCKDEDADEASGQCLNHDVYKIQNYNDPNSQLINGGCYLFHKKSLSRFQQTGPVSLEKEILPVLISEGSCYGQPFEGFFIDIGIPEDYERSQSLFLQRS